MSRAAFSSASPNLYPKSTPVPGPESVRAFSFSSSAALSSASLATLHDRHPMPPSPDPKAGSDDSSARVSDAALRKKKNADAQAAFRARRANYIATLEETGAPACCDRASPPCSFYPSRVQSRT